MFLWKEMAEYANTEVTDDMEIAVNFAKLSVSDESQYTVSEENKIPKLQGLGKKLKGLLLTYQFAAGLEQICRSKLSSYVPVKVRKYIHLLISLILEDDNPDRPILLEVFNCSTIQLP